MANSSPDLPAWICEGSVADSRRSRANSWRVSSSIRFDDDVCDVGRGLVEVGVRRAVEVIHVDLEVSGREMRPVVSKSARW